MILSLSYQLVCVSSFITSLIHTALTLVGVLLGGAATLIERKWLAFYQRRVGPNMVGHKGRLQFIADAIKILFKEIIAMKNSKIAQLFLMPLLYILLSLICVFFISWLNNTVGIQLEYSIPCMLVILNASNIVAIFVGIIQKNKYTLLAAGRAINAAILNEIGMGFLVIIILLTAGSFNFNDMLLTKQLVSGVPIFIPIAAPTLSVALIDIGKAPFDIIEAETELIMGFHSDLSGFLFVLFLLGEYLHMILFGYFMSITVG